MLLKDVFRDLSYGEFSNLKIGMEGAGSINVDDIPKVVTFTQQALTRIYTRFSHNVDYVNIRLREDVTKYPILPIHNVSDTSSENTAIRFIQDTEADPFTGNLLKIVSVKEAELTEEDHFPELLLNDPTSSNAVQLLNYYTLYFRWPEADKLLTIEYQSDHPNISEPPIDPNDEIFLLPALRPALTKLIAARVYNNMNGEENAARATRLLNEYEMICQGVESEDLAQESSSYEMHLLRDRGFR